MNNWAFQGIFLSLSNCWSASRYFVLILFLGNVYTFLLDDFFYIYFFLLVDDEFFLSVSRYIEIITIHILENNCKSYFFSFGEDEKANVIISRKKVGFFVFLLWKRLYDCKYFVSLRLHSQ